MLSERVKTEKSGKIRARVVATLPQEETRSRNQKNETLSLSESVALWNFSSLSPSATGHSNNAALDSCALVLAERDERSRRRSGYQLIVSAAASLDLFPLFSNTNHHCRPGRGQSLWSRWRRGRRQAHHAWPARRRRRKGRRWSERRQAHHPR